MATISVEFQGDTVSQPVTAFSYTGSTRFISPSLNNLNDPPDLIKPKPITRHSLISKNLFEGAAGTKSTGEGVSSKITNLAGKLIANAQHDTVEQSGSESSALSSCLDETDTDQYRSDSNIDDYSNRTVARAQQKLPMKSTGTGCRPTELAGNRESSSVKANSSPWEKKPINQKTPPQSSINSTHQYTQNIALPNSPSNNCVVGIDSKPTNTLTEARKITSHPSSVSLPVSLTNQQSLVTFLPHATDPTLKILTPTKQARSSGKKFGWGGLFKSLFKPSKSANSKIVFTGVREKSLPEQKKERMASLLLEYSKKERERESRTTDPNHSVTSDPTTSTDPPHLQTEPAHASTSTDSLLPKSSMSEGNRTSPLKYVREEGCQTTTHSLAPNDQQVKVDVIQNPSGARPHHKLAASQIEVRDSASFLQALRNNLRPTGIPKSDSLQPVSPPRTPNVDFAQSKRKLLLPPVLRAQEKQHSPFRNRMKKSSSNPQISDQPTLEGPKWLLEARATLQASPRRLSLEGQPQKNLKRPKQHVPAILVIPEKTSAPQTHGMETKGSIPKPIAPPPPVRIQSRSTHPIPEYDSVSLDDAMSETSSMQENATIFDRAKKYIGSLAKINKGAIVPAKTQIIQASRPVILSPAKQAARPVLPPEPLSDTDSEADTVISVRSVNRDFTCPITFIAGRTGPNESTDSPADDMLLSKLLKGPKPLVPFLFGSPTHQTIDNPIITFNDPVPPFSEIPPITHDLDTPELSESPWWMESKQVIIVML